MVVSPGETILTVSNLLLPGGLRLRAHLATGELVGIALPQEQQRKALIRRLLGYESGCEGINVRGQEIASLALWQLAKVRPRIGTNLSSAELLATSNLRTKFSPRKPIKVEKAKNLLAAFQEHVRFLLFGCESEALATLPTVAGERFVRWSAEFGLRHSIAPSELRMEDWRLFYLATALAVAEDFVVLDAPLEGLDSVRMIRAQDALETFRKTERKAGFFLSPTRTCVGAGLCTRWIG